MVLRTRCFCRWLAFAARRLRLRPFTCGDRRARRRPGARRAVSALGVDAGRRRRRTAGRPEAITSSTCRAAEDDAKRVTGKSTQEEIASAFADARRRARSRRRRRVRRADRPRHASTGKVAKFNLPGPGHDAGGLRAAAEEAADRSRSCSSTPRARAAVRRGAVGAGPHDRDRHAHRRASSSRRCSAATSSTR